MYLPGCCQNASLTERLASCLERERIIAVGPGTPDDVRDPTVSVQWAQLVLRLLDEGAF
jgi:hypothetical protein